MGRYRWKSWSFTPPAGLVDQSLLVFEESDGPLQVTLAIDSVSGGAPGLEAYVSRQLRDIESSVAGYQLKRREASKVGGRAACVVEQSASSRDGVPSQQHQLYLLHGEEVLIVTGTVRDGSLDRARQAVDALAESLHHENKSGGAR